MLQEGNTSQVMAPISPSQVPLVTTAPEYCTAAADQCLSAPLSSHLKVMQRRLACWKQGHRETQVLQQLVDEHVQAAAIS